MNEGLKLWCVSLNEQSVGCVDVVVKCVQCIQWSSVSDRATAAARPMCQTDFMSLHRIEVQRNVQVSADTNLLTCKSTSLETISISHTDLRTPSMLSGGNSNIFIMSVYESKNKPVSLKDVFL